MTYDWVRSCLITLIYVFFINSGCSDTRPAITPMSQIKGLSQHHRIGQIICLETGDILSFDQLIERLGSNALIFVGEVHDNPEHHLIQIQILQALMTRFGPLSVAMEFFQEPHQAFIDKYLAGITTESTFIKDVGWDKRWGYAYHFYRPLMLEVMAKGGRILAINAPNDIVRKVARSGLSSLNPDERDQLAGHIDTNIPEHRAYLARVYEEHNIKDLGNFEYFYQAQCVWEDTMAENIAGAIKGQEAKTVVFTGNGHIINKFGIPDRTRRRIPVTMSTLILYPLTHGLKLNKGMADYIWLTGNYSSRKFMVHHKGRDKSKILQKK